MRVDEASGEGRPPNLIYLVADSFRAFDRRSRHQIIGILLLTAVGAFLEAAGAALIVPFVAILTILAT